MKVRINKIATERIRKIQDRERKYFVERMKRHLKKLKVRKVTIEI